MSPSARDHAAIISPVRYCVNSELPTVRMAAAKSTPTIIAETTTSVRLKPRRREER